MLDKATLQRACPSNPNIGEWLDPLNELLPQYGITSVKREAMFLAQMGHESLDFKVTVENLNYSTKGLLTTFPKYFKTEADAAKHARQPQAIANRVYGGRMGNDYVNDGWLFRGLGIIQLTGRDNHTAFGKTIGKTAEQTREYMQTKKGMVHAACWFWDINGLNEHSDSLDIQKVTRIINGGFKGIEDRRKRLERILDIGVLKVFGLYKFGDRGDYIKKIQSALNIKADGIFGKDTKTAVKRFQESKGLFVDGIVGSSTLKALGLQ